MESLRALGNAGNWVELEEQGRLVLARNRGHEEALTLVAYSLQQRSRLGESLDFALRAAEVSTTKGHPHFLAGFALKGLGRMAEAVGHFRRALELDPDNGDDLRYLMESLAAAQGVEAAAAEYAEHCAKVGRAVEIAVARISTVPAWATACGQGLLDCGDPEEIPFEEPQFWNKPPSPERHTATTWRPYVAEVTGARILSGCGFVLTPDGAALNDLAGHPRFGSYVGFNHEEAVLGKTPGEVLLDLSGFQTREIDAGSLLAGSASNAFGHWFPDILPKLQFLQQHPDFESLPIIVDDAMPQSHFDHLRRFADNPLIRLKAGELLICRRLLVASPPSFCPVEILPNEIPVAEWPGLSPRALRFLQGGAARPAGGPAVGRFFLGRRKMKWRRLLNEDEIVGELVKLGFEAVYPEEMDAAAQIALFQRAAWIVAPNGSALLNLIFARPEVKLLILSQPGLFNWGTFQGPMRSIGYDPVWLWGENAAAGDDKHADYSVSVRDIGQALSEMGLNESRR